MKSTNRFAVAATSLLVYTVGVVLWGAFVRASLSGDGCGDHWPLCNGVALPVEPTTKTIIELTHRVTSGLCWIGTLVLYLWSSRRFSQGHATRRAAGWSLFFMTTEALVGAGLVLFRMVASNPSTARAAWMSAHLINTFLLLAALTWMAVSAWKPDGVRFDDSKWARRAFGAAAVAVLFVGVSGAVAALGDTLFPATSLAEGVREDFSATSHVFLRLRIWHPVIAVLGSGYLLWLAKALVSRGDRGRPRRLGLTLGSLVLLQIGVGLLNVWLLAPVWMQLLHLLVADVTWIVLVWLALSSPPRRSDATLAAS